MEREALRFFGKSLQATTPSILLVELFDNDVLAKMDAFVTNVYGRTGN